MKLQVATLILASAGTCLGSPPAKGQDHVDAEGHDYSAFATPLIVGGTPVIDSDTRYPWFAQFNGCGGSLIADKWVLTAAHCASAIGGTVEIGRFSNRDEDNNYDQPLYVLDVESFLPHPDYNGGTYVNDVALVKLKEPFTDVDPVPFDTTATSDGYTADSDVWAIGTGTLSSGGVMAEELMHVEISYVTPEQCDADYSNLSITSDMMCAADPGQDSCQGDSGGPLWDKDENLLVGVVSWGYGCADPSYPGVYSRISANSDWIMQKLNPEPTEAPTNAPTVDCSDKAFFTVFLKTDDYPSETFFSMSTNGETFYTMPEGDLEANTEVDFPAECLAHGVYEFKITDSYGDGICCDFGEGGYTISLDGDVIREGGDFGSAEVTTFQVDDSGATPVSSAPTPAGTDNGSSYVPTTFGTSSASPNGSSDTTAPTPTSGPTTSAPVVDCADGTVEFQVEIQADNYGSETASFLIAETGNSTVWEMPSALESDQLKTFPPVCLVPDLYNFVIIDSYGDGICCDYGLGYYKVFIDGDVIVEGGEFGSDEATLFEITETGDVLVPTPVTEPPTLCSNHFTFELTLDQSDGETQYELMTEDGTIIMSDIVAGGEFVSSSEEACLGNGVKYTFMLTDVDGLCCSQGEGGYTISLDGELLNSGGEFAGSEGVVFRTKFNFESSPSSEYD